MGSASGCELCCREIQSPQTQSVWPVEVDAHAQQVPRVVEQSIQDVADEGEVLAVVVAATTIRCPCKATAPGATVDVGGVAAPTSRSRSAEAW